MEEPEPFGPPPEEEAAVVAEATTGASGQSSGAPPPPVYATREQFDRLVQPLLPTLTRLCRAMVHDDTEAQDLLQNTLLKAYARRSTYQARGPVLSWLYGILRHEHDETVRQRARRRALLDAERGRFGEPLGGLGPAVAPSPEEQLDEAEASSAVRVCLGALPEAYKVVVTLCDLEGMPYERVAEQLGLPLGTVKSRHARGLARLRDALGPRRPVKK